MINNTAMFKFYRSHNQVIWFDDSLDNPKSRLFEPQYWMSSNKVMGSASGRGTTFFLDLFGRDVALRHYYRGGLFGKLIKDKYWFSGWENTRCYQELMTLNLLSEAGVNVPKPIGARATRQGMRYQADILTEKVQDAEDLVSVLLNQPLDPSIYQRIGMEIRKMHNAGVNHTDLNIHNILLDKQVCVWLIDFDKCGTKTGTGWQKNNLDRLLRYLKKEQKKHTIHWQRSDWETLMSGYLHSF